MSQFSAAVKKFVVDVNNLSTRNCKRLAFLVFRNVIAKTPEDTGMARMNWHCTLNVVDESHDAPAKKGRIAQKSEVPPCTLGDVYHITNALPYINRLDHGWSKDAPEGMTKPAMEKAEDALQSGRFDELD